MNNKSEKRQVSIEVAELARLLHCEFRGKGNTKITGVASLGGAEKGDLVFLSNPKYREQLVKTKASAAIVPAGEKFDRIPVLLSENPQLSFVRAVEYFFSPPLPPPGIHPQAYVSPSAKLGKNVSIGAFAYIGEDVEIGRESIIFPLAAVYSLSKIGRNCLIHSHVSIREGSQIGSRVVIHNGAVIGSEGFGYLPDKEKGPVKIPQKGIVVIEDEVEIGANTTIDRASLGKTVIRRGAKIDNLVQIAHNVEIGPYAILAAQAGIAGSSTIGKNVVIAGQSGVADHVTVGEDAIIAAKTGVGKDIRAGSMVAGIPHLDIRVWRKACASVPHLYEGLKEIKRLKKKIEELERKAGPDSPE
jgi:UDP-3-O-[3-hydroxymyristoyl] glucosamine N-acyltransferase